MPEGIRQDLKWLNITIFCSNSHINSVKWLYSPWVLIAQWIEHLPSFREVMGSIPTLSLCHCWSVYFFRFHYQGLPSLFKYQTPMVFGSLDGQPSVNHNHAELTHIGNLFFPQACSDSFEINLWENTCSCLVNFLYHNATCYIAGVFPASARPFIG